MGWKMKLAAVAALALVAAACGDDGSGDTTTTTTQAATSTTQPTTTTTTQAATTTTSGAVIDANIDEGSKVTTLGLGPVRVGMTPEEASAAAGFPLTVDNPLDDPSCYYLLADPVLPGVGFMVTEGRVARVDVWDGPVTTRSGAGIGMTEDEIKALFPGQIEEEPHQYSDGKYLIFVPVDEADKDYRVIWETDVSGVVTQYRAGVLPEVSFVEGCA